VNLQDGVGEGDDKVCTRLSNGLNDTIKEVESMQETVRNKRQMASTAFQNFDQKANQLYNLMSSVMKAMNEMRMGTVRNML
jgi:methyl-accepting chemotaxis protein